MLADGGGYVAIPESTYALVMQRLRAQTPGTIYGGDNKQASLEELLVAARPAIAIQIDGSSTVFLISQAVAEDFSQANNSRVAGARSGTGAGVHKICRRHLSITRTPPP